MTWRETRGIAELVGRPLAAEEGLGVDELLISQEQLGNWIITITKLPTSPIAKYMGQLRFGGEFPLGDLPIEDEQPSARG